MGNNLNETVVFLAAPLALALFLSRSHIFSMVVLLLMQGMYWWKKTAIVDDLSSGLMWLAIILLLALRIIEQRWPGGKERPTERTLLWGMAGVRFALNFVYLQEMISVSRDFVLPNFGGKVTSIATGMVEYLNMGLIGVAGIAVLLIVLYLGKPQV